MGRQRDLELTVDVGRLSLCKLPTQRKNPSKIGCSLFERQMKTADIGWLQRSRLKQLAALLLTEDFRTAAAAARSKQATV